MSRKEYLREWRKTHPENVRQHKRNYYQKHKDEINKKLRDKNFENTKHHPLRHYYCPTCDRWDVHWDHEHFDPPKRTRHWYFPK